jgi:hypothetical protein
VCRAALEQGRYDDLPLLVRVSYSGLLVPRNRLTDLSFAPVAVLLLFICACVRISSCVRLCCDDKTDFGLEFPRSKTADETLPWLSEQNVVSLCACSFDVCVACIYVCISMQQYQRLL